MHLRTLTAKELMRHADNQPSLTPLERELLDRLRSATNNYPIEKPVTPRPRAKR